MTSAPEGLWFGRGLWLVPLALALAIRVIHVVEIGPGPYPNLQVWTQSDMHFFDRWARSIAEGDLWSNPPMRPYHVWHDTVAREAYMASGRPGEEFTSETGRSMWNQWLGDRRFYQDPGYVYAVGAIYAVFGHENRAVWVAQTFLGLGCVLLVFSIARALYGPTAATLSACAAALYGPLVFYEPVLLRTIVISFVGLLALRLGIAAVCSPGPRVWAAAGMAAGVGYLVKTTAILPAGIVLAVGVFARRRSYASASRFVVVFASGWLLATAPLAIRNMGVGLTPWSGAATGVISFVRHNYAGYEPGRGSGVSPQVARIMLQSGGQARPAVSATVSSFATVLGWPRLLTSKFFAFWTPYEIPNNINYAYWKLLAPWTAAMTLSFAWIALPAAAGFAARSRQDSRQMLFAATVLTSIAVCVLFFNLSRFRLPIALMIMPAAGAGLVEIASTLVRRPTSSIIRTIVAIGVAGALVGLAGSRVPETIRVADYGVANKVAVHMARMADRRGDSIRALEILDKQLLTEPSSLAGLVRGGTPRRVNLADGLTAGSFAEVHAAVADVYAHAGRAVPSRRHRERAALYSRIDYQATRRGKEGSGR